MSKNCPKCGGKSGGDTTPHFSVTTTHKQIDGENAKVQFRYRMVFDLNGVGYQFLTGEVVLAAPYNVIAAALSIDPNSLIWLNLAEKADFESKYNV